MMTPQMTTPSSGSDAAIRRALEILSGLSGGYTDAGGDATAASLSGHAADGGAYGGGGGAIGNAAAQAAANAAGSGTGTVTAAGSNSIPPELSQLLNLMFERMRFQENLFRSVTNQAYQGLPKYAQWTGSAGGPGGAIGPGV